MVRQKTVSNKNSLRTSAEKGSSRSNKKALSQTMSHENSPDAAHPNGLLPESKPVSARPHPAPDGTLVTGALHVIATPIGNANDVSVRALAALQAVDIVACEDTRVTSKLFTRHSIHTRLCPYHEHNAEKVRPGLIKRLKDGETVALVSDAGTPMVSDPGYKLVRACIEEGVPVTALPGASSVMTALVLSGLPTDRFFFNGFLPQKKKARQNVLRELAEIPATIVLMESPRRLAASLEDMTRVLGSRDAAVCREMTKLYEETRRGTLPELAEAYAASGAPKGEVVVVVGPPRARPELPETDIDRHLEDAMARLSLRDAVREVTDLTGMPRQGVYQRALALSKGSDGNDGGGES